MRDKFLRCLITRNPFELTFYLVHEYPDGEMDILDISMSPRFRKLERNEASPAGLPLTLEAGQQIMDELWNLGYRPSKGISSSGQDDAQKSHLADLKTIVFKLLDIK